MPAIRSASVVGVCLFAMGWASPAGGADKLTPAKFQQLHKAMQPKDAPWRTIPWKISLLDGQRTAAKEGKPIFLWAMDGHPLGCT